MPDQTTNPALLRFARSDLRRAKKTGEIAITDTLRGLLSLSFSCEVYTLAIDVSAGGEVLAQGSAAVVAAALANLYSVSEE